MVALVVTIVVLIILATISINAAFHDNGIIKKAQEAKEAKEKLTQMQESEMNSLLQEYTNMMAGEGNIGGGITDPDGPVEPEKIVVNKDTVSSTEHEKIIGEDTLGNQVVIPNGFKIADDSGETVQDGIVIEDAIGNQFVWIPVSNIDGDGVIDNQTATGLITKKDGSKVQITLGRYTFDSTRNNTTQTIDGTGEAAIAQKGLEYGQEHIIKPFGYDYIEVTPFRESNYKTDTTGTNTTALSLERFVTSVQTNKGYYIARYEASFGSGDQPTANKINTSEYITNQKPLSQKSTTYNRASNTEALKKGMLWNYINQPDASKVCRNMYLGNEYVESDLMNSYMWDTAIVYIQAMGNDNYASANRNNTGNSILLNTGETGDEKCHIFDMAGNLLEWTTEYSSAKNNNYSQPSMFRGAYYNDSNYWTAWRGCFLFDVTQSFYSVSFRPGMYIK